MKKTQLNSSKYIGKSGYTIRKADYSELELHNIRNELTMTPENPQLKKMMPHLQAPSFYIYQENKDKLYLPKFYGLEKIGIPEYSLCNDKKYLQKIKPIEITFQGTLRDKQHEIADLTISTLQKEHGSGGLLQLPCGFGKTICALYILSKLKCKTMIIVHKEFLMNQWKERIEEFLPDAKVGIIKQKKVDTKGKDIVIAMLQSLSMRSYDASIFEDFGLAIYDEAHHMGAEVFSKCFSVVQTKMMLGLSATPDRKDGLSRVFHYYIGPVLASIDTELKQDVYVKPIKIADKNAKEVIEENAAKINPRCDYITHLVMSEDRNEAIVSEILRLIQENEERQILILSERREHLKQIDDCLKMKNNQIQTGYYWGGLKQIELDFNSNAQVLFGTYSMSSEGMDIPSLNTVILASPKADIVQSVGRILRRKHNLDPLIIDIIDTSYQSFVRQWYKRKQIYKDQGFLMYEENSNHTKEKEKEKEKTLGCVFSKER
jgi:superfamily II DNA or RNA helicase